MKPLDEVRNEMISRIECVLLDNSIGPKGSYDHCRLCVPDKCEGHNDLARDIAEAALSELHAREMARQWGVFS